MENGNAATAKELVRRGQKIIDDELVVNPNPMACYLGMKVFIRTVTHHYTGIVAGLVCENAFFLERAAWIADDGRLSEAVRTGDFNEVEMFQNPVMLNFAAVLDVTQMEVIPGRTV